MIELDECDNYGHEENCTIPSFPEVCSYFRNTISGKNSLIRSPITLSVLSIAGEPIGIKCVTFCSQRQRERGVFLHINLETWIKSTKAGESNTKKKKKYLVSFPANENFNLTPCLDKGGYIHILKSHKWETGSDSQSIEGVEINSMQPIKIAPLESVLKIESIS